MSLAVIIQPGGIGDRIVPGDADDGVIGSLQLRGLLAEHVRRKCPTRRLLARAYEAGVLHYGDREAANVESTNPDPGLGLFVFLAVGVVQRIAAHQELPRAHAAERWNDEVDAI